MNRITDSRPRVTSPYVTSDFPDNVWGQLSLSHYVIEVVEGSLRAVLIDGIYLASQAEMLSIPEAMTSGFAAWEAASERALAHVGSLYRELADDDLALAEMGIGEYAAELKRLDEGLEPLA